MGRRRRARTSHLARAPPRLLMDVVRWVVRREHDDRPRRVSRSSLTVMSSSQKKQGDYMPSNGSRLSRAFSNKIEKNCSSDVTGPRSLPSWLTTNTRASSLDVMKAQMLPPSSTMKGTAPPEDGADGPAASKYALRLLWPGPFQRSASFGSRMPSRT